MFEQNQILYKVSASTQKVQTWKGWLVDNEVCVAYGQEGGKMQVSMYDAEPKNIGKVNETTANEQAVVELQALYQAQIDNCHYHLTRDAAVSSKAIIPRKIKNYKDHWKSMSSTLLSSTKKNGSRACVISGVLYSKIGKEEEVKVEHLRNALCALKEVATFDAEVYAHGLSLQRIRSAWLKPVKTAKEVAKIKAEYLNKTGKDLPYDPNEDALRLKFHIFDVPVEGLPFNERIKLMRTLENHIKIAKLSDCFEFIYPGLTMNGSQRLLLRDKVVAQGYEGMVHYEPKGVYEFGVRSSNTQKDKPRYDSEALVLGIERCKNGDGKLMLMACDELDNVEFKTMMKVDRRDGIKYPRDMESMREMIGKWITFSYEELSDKGIPTKPVGEEVRKCDSFGNPLE